MKKKFILVLGGVRSGKSAHAVKLASSNEGDVLFVATAQAGDDEMKTRIEAHQAERNPDWFTLEAENDLGKKIISHEYQVKTVLIDCMSLLVTNIMMSMSDDVCEHELTMRLDEEMDGIKQAYEQGQATWIIVSNEVGMGLVPPYPSGRIFRDCLGRLNQKMAAYADEVFWMVAGIAVRIK